MAIQPTFIEFADHDRAQVQEALCCDARLSHLQLTQEQLEFVVGWVRAVQELPVSDVNVTAVAERCELSRTMAYKVYKEPKVHEACAILGHGKVQEAAKIAALGYRMAVEKIVRDLHKGIRSTRDLTADEWKALRAGYNQVLGLASGDGMIATAVGDGRGGFVAAAGESDDVMGFLAQLEASRRGTLEGSSRLEGRDSVPVEAFVEPGKVDGDADLGENGGGVRGSGRLSERKGGSEGAKKASGGGRRGEGAGEAGGYGDSGAGPREGRFEPEGEIA